MTSGRGAFPAAVPWAAALLITLGCAGAAANKRSPGVIESGQFKPTRPTAAKYGPDPALACPERGVNGLLDEEVAPTGAKPEGRLCAVADTLLGWEGDVPPDTVLSVISSDFGLPQQVRRVILQNIETAEETSKGVATGAQPKDVAAQVAEPIKNFAANAQNPRYGFVIQRVKKTAGSMGSAISRISLVMQDQNVEIQPIPRNLAPGQTATLSGTLLGKLTNPKVRYTDAVGKLEQPPAQPGKAFSADIKCGDRPGRILVQVVGEQEGADVQVVAFPIGCGKELPVAAAVSGGGKDAAAAATTDPATGEKQLLDQINQDRAGAGLQPLNADPDLSKVARSLSDDRAKGKAASSADVQQKLKEAEISAATILVSEAQALGAEDAYTRFSNSPQDRANAMNADVNQVGIGIAPGPKVGDRPTVIVTQLYMKQLPPPDPAQVKAKLYDAIQQKRADARAGSVAKDATLEQIAQEYAEEMAKQKGGRVPKERLSEIEVPLRKSFATVNEMGGVKPDPLEFAEESGIIGDAKLVGVGVSVGNSAQFGKNSAFVVILLGKKHAPAPAASTKKPIKR